VTIHFVARVWIKEAQKRNIWYWENVARVIFIPVCELLEEMSKNVKNRDVTLIT
jgi:hypothetical protein